jgi:hypothetical protein
MVLVYHLPSKWLPIATAPSGSDLRVCVIDKNGIHSLVFPCRKKGAADRYPADALAPMERGLPIRKLGFFRLGCRQLLCSLLSQEANDHRPFGRISFGFEQQVKSIDVGSHDFIHGALHDERSGDGRLGGFRFGYRPRRRMDLS